MMHRIREMLSDLDPQMLGDNKTVEVDEVFIGGKESNKHESKKNIKTKSIVIGAIERGGKAVTKHIPTLSYGEPSEFISEYVSKGSTVYTDEASVYKMINDRFFHSSVKHSLGNYVNGDTHTNTIENFWSLLKRGLYGIYHQVSEKHLERYLEEFSARFNTRGLTEHQRFEHFLGRSERVLTYERLISDKKNRVLF